jgi:glutamine amidotransferase
MKKVAVIDYGMGNLHSVAKAFEHVGKSAHIPLTVNVTSDPSEILSADRVVFPGVGAIRDCMAEILRLNLHTVVQEAMQSKPVLAICVGMQALMTHSDENGGVDCIGLLKGQVRQFAANMTDAAGARLKVPHMGWNCVSQTSPHFLWRDIPDHSRFYFVHSYYVDAGNPQQVAGKTAYGVDFCSALHSGNVFAVQFHPEKSQASGLTLLRNFLSWDGDA